MGTSDVAPRESGDRAVQNIGLSSGLERSPRYPQSTTA